MASENDIQVPPRLVEDGRLLHTITGSGNRLSCAGIRFKPPKSTFLRVMMTGDDASVSLGLLRRVIKLDIRIGADACVKIGDETSFRSGVEIVASEGRRVTIGKDCMFSSDILVRTTDSHRIFDLDTNERINPDADIVIGDHVWIGRGVRILKGASIGSGSVIGAGSIVTGEIEPNCIAAGQPARRIRGNIRWER